MARQRNKKKRNKVRTKPSKTWSGKEVPMSPIVKGDAPPRRNDPCPCGSTRKWKNCHGKKQQAVHHSKSPYADLRQLYGEKHHKAEKEFVTQWGFNPNPTQLMVFMGGDQDEIRELVIKAMRRMESKDGIGNERFVYAIEKLDRLVTPLNTAELEDSVNRAWSDALHEYDERESEPAGARSPDAEQSEPAN
jgi:hypothetical protein